MTDTINLRARIAEELERQPSDIIGDNSLSVGIVINRQINSAILHYESTRFRWNEIREEEFTTFTDGTRIYSLPANLVRLDTLKVILSDSYIPLRKRTWDYLEDQDRNVSQSEGIPFDWAVYGNVLRVYPTPNRSLTAVGSYIRRIRPTSLSGSFCSVLTMGGGSLTATTTASHGNRIDGWTTDGEELIRARAVASFEIFYLKNEDAKTEMGLLAAAREPYLSVREKQAFERLVDEAQDAGATGLIRPYCV